MNLFNYIVSNKLSQIVSVLASFSSLILLLLLFILGDTYLRWFLLPLFMVCLGVLTVIQIQRQQVYAQYATLFRAAKVGSVPFGIKTLLFVWSLFIAWVFFTATFTTHDLGLSIDAVLFHGSLFLIFILGLNVSFLIKQINTTFIATLFVLIGVVLSFLSFAFMLQPNLSHGMPGLNLLVASYGHNHLASYILLILPLAWWLVATFRNKLSIAVTALLTISLLISFGRVAILIGFIQLFFLLHVCNNRFFIQPIQKKIRNLIFIVAMILMTFFVSILVFKTVLSISPSFFPDTPVKELCPFDFKQVQLCKPLRAEARPDYWMQAILAVIDYPLFGYGPGTFSLISKKYATVHFYTTGYAHNAYLHLFAETGVIGGLLFILKMVGLVYLPFRAYALHSQKKSTDAPFYLAVFIGLVSLAINNIFDFDWSFIGVSISAVILSASSMISVRNSNRIFDDPYVIRHRYTKMYITNITKVMAALTIIVLAVLTMAVWYSEYLFSTQQYRQLLKTFPYTSHHRIGLVRWNDWTTQELDQLVKIYKHNYIALEILLKIHQDYPHWLSAYRLLESSFAGFSYTDPLFIRWVQKNLDLEKQILEYERIIENHHTLIQRHVSYEWYPNKGLVSFAYITAANQVYATGDLERAARMYIKAFEHEYWSLSEYLIAFAYTVPVKNYQIGHVGGQQSDQLVAEIVSQIEYDPELLRFMRTLVTAVDELGYNTHLFREVYALLLTQKIATCSQTINITNSCDECWCDNTANLQQDIRNIARIGHWKLDDIWRVFMEAYSTYDSTHETKTVPVSISILPIWEEFKLAYAHEPFDWNGYPYNETVAMLLQQEALDILGTYNQNLFEDHEPYQFSDVDRETLIRIVKAMQSMVPYEYTVTAQLGHLYLAMGEYELAQQAYSDCINHYAVHSSGYTHYECVHGLDPQILEWSWQNRFAQVGAIFLGLNDWDDF